MTIVASQLVENNREFLFCRVDSIVQITHIVSRSTIVASCRYARIYSTELFFLINCEGYHWFWALDVTPVDICCLFLQCFNELVHCIFALIHHDFRIVIGINGCNLKGEATWDVFLIYLTYVCISKSVQSNRWSLKDTFKCAYAANGALSCSCTFVNFSVGLSTAISVRFAFSTLQNCTCDVSKICML